jgi:outer membrane protein assembly factor BamB
VVYVGDWTGKVYALSAASGATRWTFQTGDKVKDAIAFAGGRVYFGSYDHHVYALNARTGKLFWKASAQQRLGSRGTFYSTPAVAYNRVYIGSTDGKVYSFGATSGKVRWSHGTGGYVYSSPAVFEQRVYAGSFTGDLYCFDAATGDVKWKYRTNGPIMGWTRARASWSGRSGAARTRRWSPTGGGSTSWATRGSSPWLRGCVGRLTGREGEGTGT